MTSYKSFPASATSGPVIQPKSIALRGDKKNYPSCAKLSNETVEIYLLSHNKLKYSGTLVEYIGALRHCKQGLDKIVDTLCEAIRSLRISQDYNGVYIAYLLDQLSEEEFIKESEKYCFDPKTELTDEIIEKIDILLYYTKEKFSPSDLSDIFKVDVNIVEKALEQSAIACGIINER